MEPSTVTVNFDKLTGPTYDTSLSATADQGVLGYPVYLDSDNNIRAMSETDYRDTFIYATLTDMVSSKREFTYEWYFHYYHLCFCFKLH